MVLPAAPDAQKFRRPHCSRRRSPSLLAAARERLGFDIAQSVFLQRSSLPVIYCSFSTSKSRSAVTFKEHFLRHRNKIMNEANVGAQMGFLVFQCLMNAAQLLQHR